MCWGVVVIYDWSILKKRKPNLNTNINVWVFSSCFLLEKEQISRLAICILHFEKSYLLLMWKSISIVLISGYGKWIITSFK